MDDPTNQLSKFRTKNWVEIHDESQWKYDHGNIKFKTSMTRSNLCNYRDGYILVKPTITVLHTAAVGPGVNNTNKKVIFTNCAPFSNFLTKIDNTQVGEAQDIDIVIPTYSLIGYSDVYSKTSWSLWQYHRD